MTRRLRQGSHRQPRLMVEEAPPHPARGSAEPALPPGPPPAPPPPAPRFASGGREMRAADLQCVNVVTPAAKEVAASPLRVARHGLAWFLAGHAPALDSESSDAPQRSDLFHGS